MRSVPEMDLSENEVLDKLTEKAANHEETILVAKEFDSVIRSQKSGFWTSHFVNAKSLNALKTRKDLWKWKK